MRITHRGLPALLAATVGLVPLSLAVTALSVAPANAAPTDIKINEIITNSGSAPDSIELTNIGAEAVDVSGWILKDNNDTRTLAIASGTTIAPGAFLAVPVDVTGGFGLGNGDAARVYLADGTTLVDGHTFPSHSAPSWSRCPDGTGEFVQANAETLGAANDCPGVEDLVINEVESNGDPVGDWIELANPTGLAIDATGLVVKDSDDSRTLTVPADTVVPAGGYASVYTEPAADPAGFGLGGADSARIFTADGTTLIDSYSWEAHATTSYGRCPDRTGDFGTTLTTTRAAANDCPVPSGADDLVINEISSNPFDFVELKNVSDGPVELSGLKVADNSAAPITITTESTTLQPGALYSFSPDALPGGFGLGSSDTATIYLADGVTVVDTYSWVGHRIPSYGICPGSDELVENAAASPGAANVCQPIRINEVESSGGEPGDWIELVNATASPVDVSGWVVKDNDDTHTYVVPDATSLAAGARLVLDEADLGFGFGSADAARLFRADGTTLVDSHDWTSHATTTYGRCADTAGDFVTTRSATKGAVNDCPPPFYGVDTVPWPGSQDITLADPQNAFVSAVSTGDVSGLAFDPTEDGVLWAIKNKNRLFKLTKVEGLWTPLATDGWAGGKELKFANGAGEPDTEGVTVGPDGAIYATSERDNTASSVPLNTVLRYDPTQPGPLTATDEWNLDADFPELDSLPGGSNLGFEGLTWVPDEFLVGGGFIDGSTAAAYDPSDYPGHGDGLFFMALENDGKLYGYALGDGTAHRVATVSTGFPHAMDVTFDPERQRIWAACDDTCDGQVSVLEIGADGHFTVDTGYDRPTGMPDLNNEGFAIAPQSTCTAGFKQVVWSDDAGTGGHSLRASTLPCTEIADPTPVANTALPTITGKAKVGWTLTGTAGAWTPTPATTTYQWLADGVPVSGATSPKLKVAPAHVGKAITVRVTVSADGFLDGTATSAATAKVTRAPFAFARGPRIAGLPRAGKVLTARIGTVTPSPTTVRYHWLVDGRRIPGATGAQVRLLKRWAGHRITVKVRYARAGYETRTVTSSGVRVIR